MCDPEGVRLFGGPKRRWENNIKAGVSALYGVSAFKGTVHLESHCAGSR